MTRAEYDLFASDLSSFHLPDIESALNEIAERPRREGETAIPDTGTLRLAIERQARQRAVAVAYQVWGCASCKRTQASVDVAPCHFCKGMEMKRLTRQDTPLSEYHAELEQHPERFVSMDGIAGEARRNVAMRQL